MLFGDSQLSGEVARLRREVRRQGELIEYLAKQVGATLPETTNPYALVDKEIAEIENGKPVSAIKLYRERTGAGLLEAKEAVDEYTKKN